MDRMYFVSYAKRPREGGDWDFFEVVLEIHPMVWMARIRTEEKARVQADVNACRVTDEQIFRLLSWQKLDGDDAAHASALLLGRAFPIDGTV